MDKTIVIVLGNRLNDDGTITKIQEERLLMALELEELVNPDCFILTGGLANEKAGRTEAFAMYQWLLDHGITEERLILENKSLSTVENALYSVPIAKSLGAKRVIVCSSAYHFADPRYKAIESFTSQLANSGIALMIYCKE